MAKIVKFTVFMIILLSLFFVATNLDVGGICVRDKDCPNRLCPYPHHMRCRKSICICR
ncbi:unnamed protein product [Trifolium pratense]|uniref:Uncharacterized protein n=1 Tax=Trifolium pratense TaxID=57577 RepID=A0ACB0LM90_TRIPR|nr:unnamed protein product [Trifolium pratense]